MLMIACTFLQPLDPGINGLGTFAFLALFL
jgi:hypothetical protein